MYICDTNVILRYLLADSTEQFAEVEPFFKQVALGETEALLEQAVFTETIFVLLSFYEIPKQNIVHSLVNLIAYKGIRCDKDLYIRSLEIYYEHNLNIVDCLIIAKNNITQLPVKSFDKKLLKLLKD